MSRKSTLQFAQETLAAPLGFRLSSWPRDPQGIYSGGNEMLLTPKQMAAIGELYLIEDSSRAARSFRRPGSIPPVCRGRRQSGMVTGNMAMAGGSRRSADKSLLRVGIRRPIHLRFPRPQPRRGRDVVDNRQRRAARPSSAVVRFDRAPSARAGVCDHGAGQLKMRPGH